MRRFALTCAAVSVAVLAGCGAPAAPQPPTLDLPAPVRDLSATRVGGIVHLTFSVPQKTTDKLPVKGDMVAQVCRSVEAQPCQPAGSIALAAAQAAPVKASMDDALPSDLTQGPPRLMTYRVSVLNHGGKSASASAPAFAVAGIAPAPVTGFQATPRRNGIVLSWQNTEVVPQETGVVRFNRTRTAGPSTPVQQPGLGSRRSQEEPAEQTLRVPESVQEHRRVALDATAHTGQTYRYTAQRVETVQLGRHTLEFASAMSQPVTVVYSDVFPPPPPTGLVSAADTPGRAVDLSWTPGDDPSVAGFIVYRRWVQAGNATAPERISPAGKPVGTPAWRDSTVVAGQRYLYSVSAVDASGNESARSAEVEDGLRADAPHP